MRIIAFLLLIVLAGCSVQTGSRPEPASQASLPTISAKDVPQRFTTAVGHMRPQLVRTCKDTSPDLNCDFVIAIDPDPKSPPNAFQTVNEEGQPILGFTMALLTDMRNADEIAFVIGHEGAHHILRHLDRQKQSARGGATLFGVLAETLGGSARSVDAASSLGAAVGGRTYSKNYELEADHLGAQVTQRAGFDPVLGAMYFMRIPGPGNKFFGTHPRNADRIAGVRAAVGK